MDEERRHNLIIKNRESLEVTDVDEVESFDEERVIVSTSMGIITVTGAEFKIHKLNVDDGQLTIEGIIDEIKYSDIHNSQKSGGFLSSLFK